MMKFLKKRAGVFRAVFNAILYLHSQDAELEKTYPFSKTSFSKTQQKKRRILTTDCMIPVTFIHRGYHEKHYSKDSTFVQSHLRWQRCGVGLSQVKLVWVREHERTFN